MVKDTNIGDTIPRGSIRDNQTDDENSKDTAELSIEGLSAQIEALREQVSSLQSVIARKGRKAGRAVKRGARQANEAVSEQVGAHPLMALAIAAGIGFLLGQSRMPQFYQHRSDTPLDQLRHRLTDLSASLPANVRSSLRSALR
mgnify:CR=1 FL=1